VDAAMEEGRGAEGRELHGGTRVGFEEGGGGCSDCGLWLVEGGVVGEGGADMVVKFHGLGMTARGCFGRAPLLSMGDLCSYELSVSLGRLKLHSVSTST